MNSKSCTFVEDEDELHFVIQNAKVKTEENRSPRLLCLHGKGSNIEISKLQISRLELDQYFEVTFLQGPFRYVEQSRVGSEYPDLYAWTSSSEDISEPMAVSNIHCLLKSLILILRHVEVYGSYDAVYGFSQGASLATVLTYADIRAKIMSMFMCEPTFASPWKFVFLGWAANTIIPKVLFDYFYGQDDSSSSLKTKFGQIDIPSVHYIGLADEYKVQSEEIACLFDDEKSMVLYFEAAHEVRFMENSEPENLLSDALQWFESNSSSTELCKPETKGRLFKMKEEIRANLCSAGTCSLRVGVHGQYVIVDNEIQPRTLNLMKILKRAKPDAIAIRMPNSAAHLTYGELIEFISTEGNLRRFGVQTKDRIAFVAPSGALSAVAFLTITTQCASVPLDPYYTTQDFMLAFKQIQPKFLIVFCGLEDTSVMEAARLSNLTVIRARYIERTCGLFSYENLPEFRDENVPCNPHENEADQDALILRTSGTTSIPKIVPLKMHALLTNALAISNNLGLSESDIAINAMPLFHIGGISSNLLSTLISGGSVVMMPSFDVQEFFNLISEIGVTSPNICRSIKPTWYSAVPTMHTAIVNFVKGEMERENIKQFKHSLRFIRTGAAKMSQDLAEEMQEIFKCPVVPTYSMTELMPISQPPTNFRVVNEKPNSVGKPLVASLAIMGTNMLPLEYERKDGNTNIGEICLSGPTVFDQYENNTKANSSSFFLFEGKKWFRTGDLGHLDREGFLFVTGRIKEMIKRGGEQISPLEVEEILDTHPIVKKSLVFPIPDKLWGERVGAAIVLEDEFAKEAIEKENLIKKELKKYFSDTNAIVHSKFPEEIVFVKLDQIPQTRSGKYIRNGLSDLLGITDRVQKENISEKPKVKLHEAVVGLRFVLALAVCWVHIGGSYRDDMSSMANPSSEVFSWDRSRGWCIHTPLFFMLGGFLLANGTGTELKGSNDFLKFYSMRILSLHPMYLFSILICTINYCMWCRPSNFNNTFMLDRTPSAGQHFVCQATPLEMSYSGTLTSSILTYIFALQAWPTVIPMSWFLSAYSWFSSVFYFCIVAFPWCHRVFYRRRLDVKALWKMVIVLIAIDIGYMGVVAAYFGINDFSRQNFFLLGMYLLPPGWLPSFALGIAFFFLFQYYSNTEHVLANRRFWAVLNDSFSIIFLVCWLFYGLSDDSLPSFARSGMNTRNWYAFVSRLLIPFTSFWVWGLANGGGLTSQLLSSRLMVEYLAPASYNMFLFHQPISEWYFLATRGTWWSYPKPFYWFSPYPTPINMWEFPIVAFIVISVAIVMERYVNGVLTECCASICSGISRIIFCEEKIYGNQEYNTSISELELVKMVVKSITRSEVSEETNLNDAGINSMMSAILINMLNQKLPCNCRKLTVVDLRRLETVGDVAQFVSIEKIDVQSGRKTVSSKDSDEDSEHAIIQV